MIILFSVEIETPFYCSCIMVSNYSINLILSSRYFLEFEQHGELLEISVEFRTKENRFPPRIGNDGRHDTDKCKAIVVLNYTMCSSYCLKSIT